jgi:hypothetical protein
MNIDNLITESKAKFDHNLAKHYLKEKYTAKLIFADQGGLWQATPEFLSFLSTSILNETVILDLYDNPIKVSKDQLSLTAYQIYHSVMIEWYEEWSSLQNKR